MDRKTILLYVVLGSIGAIFFVAILGTITGATLVSTFGAFQKAFLGKVIKFSIAGSEKALSLAQGTITTVGSTSLSAISMVSSASAAIQKSLFETTFLVANMAGVAVEGAVTTVKELLEVMMRMTEKLVSMIAKFANTSLEMVSNAMKATAKMLSKTEDTVKKFSFEAVVPAITKAFNLTKDMAMNVGKIMGKILPMYMNILKRGMEVIVGGEVFMVGLYAVSAYVSVTITLGKGFLDKLFGTSVIELIINALKGVFTNILVGSANPFSICNIVTNLIYPVFAPVVAPNIPLFGSTLKRCDRELIRLGLATITKGKLCKAFPVTAAQAVFCLLEKVGTIEILPRIPRIAFGPRDFMRMAGINPKVFGRIGGFIPSVGIGPFGPFTINRLLSGIANALADFLDMAMREVTKEMKNMTSSFGSEFKSVSFAISNPRPAGAMTVQAREQTTSLTNASNSLTSSLRRFESFPPKYPDYDIFLSNEVYPVLLRMARLTRLITTSDITFSTYSVLYGNILPSQLKGALGDVLDANEETFRVAINMDNHGYRISEQVWIETTSGFVRSQVERVDGRNRFEVSTKNIIQTPRIFEAPSGFTNTSNDITVPMIDVENFLLRVIRKKFITRFIVDAPFYTFPSGSDGIKIEKTVFDGSFYGIGSDERVWRLTGSIWTPDNGTPTQVRDLYLHSGKLLAATPQGIFVKQGAWTGIATSLSNVHSLMGLNSSELIIGGDGRVDIFNHINGSVRNILNDIDGPVKSIAVNDDASVIYIGGDFFNVEGATFNLVAGYDISENKWFALRTGIQESTSEPAVTKLIFNAGRLIAYGSFNPVYIYDVQRDVWDRFRTPTRVFSDFTLDDNTILFCLESGALRILYPNTITLVDLEIELTEKGSLYQDGENVIINGRNRINLNNIRLSSPTVSGLITIRNGIARSTVKLFVGTTLTIGTLRTEVTGTSGDSVTLSVLPSGSLTSAPFVGRIPPIAEEISNIYFANVLSLYTLSTNGLQFTGSLNISSSGKVTSEQDMVIGTIITTSTNFRTKVVDIISDGFILNPPFPPSSNNSSVTFTGNIPTIISFLDDIVRLNPSNTFISNAQERNIVNQRLRELYSDFIDNSTIIPARYLQLRSFESEVELISLLLEGIPELALIKFRAGGIDDGTNASIPTLLITAFRQMLRALLRRVFQEWQSARDRMVSFLRNVPGIPGFSFCIIWFIKCRKRISTPSINFHSIATRVSSLVDSIVLKLMDLSDAFLDKLMGPSANNSATPEFDYQ